MFGVGIRACGRLTQGSSRASEPQIFFAPQPLTTPRAVTRPSFGRSAVSDPFLTTRSRTDVSILIFFISMQRSGDQTSLNNIFLNNMLLNMLLNRALPALGREWENRHIDFPSPPADVPAKQIKLAWLTCS